MTARRMVSAMAVAALVLLLAVHPAAPAQSQQPQLAEVLKRAAAYVERFHTQLSEIVAEETYEQIVYNSARFNNPVLANAVRRTLRSDFMLVKPSNVDRYVEFRDVFEVDGETVRDRRDRLAALWRGRSPESSIRLDAILEESARYNIGGVQRNINTPLMPLLFLNSGYQERFSFTHIAKSRPVFSGRDATDTSGLFRVKTEMWNIEFEERRGNTIIKRPNGGNLRSRGRFWIDPDTGAVLISELIVDGGGVLAKVTVSYQSEPLMGFLVPVEMRESYERRDEVITGHAVYGRFRLLKQ
jgi:hypothetical protein